VNEVERLVGKIAVEIGEYVEVEEQAVVNGIQVRRCRIR